jgi:hypothetical protein
MTAITILVAFVLVIAPGAGLSLSLLGPRRRSLTVQMGAAIPFGFLVVGGTAFVLALAHVLYLWTLLAAVVASTGVAWTVALRAASIRERLAAWREEISAERWAYVMLLVMIGVLVAVRLTYSGFLELRDQTPLRYWADGLEIADAHRIPALSLQWGHMFPTTVSKVLLNCFNAAGSMVLGRGPIAPMEALLTVTFFGIVLVAFALARELGLRYTAPLLVLVLFVNRFRGSHELTIDLVHYRAENVGRLVMLGGVLFVVLALRAERFRDGRREAVIAGATLGGLAGTHLIPLGIGLVLTGGYALARIVVDRRPRVLLRLGGAILGIAFLVGGLILTLPRGDIGFQAVGDTGAYRRLAVELGQRPCWDPTRFLTSDRLDQACHGTEPSARITPLPIARSFVRSSFGIREVRIRYLILLPLLYGAAIGLAFAFGSRDLRAATVTAVLLAGILLLTAVLFAVRSKVYVIALFGPRRLFDYAGIPVAISGLAIVEIGVMALGRVRIARSRRPWMPVAASGLALAVTLAVFAPRDLRDRAYVRYLATAEGPFGWIERNVPCNGLILADRRTLATFEVFTRRGGFLEGMGPYFRPDLLVTAIRQLLAARAFFEHPAAGEPFLRSVGIAAIVVTKPAQSIGGASRVGPIDPAELASLPFLRVAARSASLTVYQVMGFDPTEGHGPDTALIPGYGCEPPA